MVDVGAATHPTRTALALQGSSSVNRNPPSSGVAPQSPVPLGRLATRIALTLMGKHKPIYNPSTDCGDYVVAVGCRDLHITGKKAQQKLYYKQTTRPGSLRSMSLEQLKAKWGGSEILRRAVRGMLPKNRLREKRLARLKGLSQEPQLYAKSRTNRALAYEGLAHPHKQNLFKFPFEENLTMESPSGPISRT